MNIVVYQNLIMENVLIWYHDIIYSNIFKFLCAQIYLYTSSISFCNREGLPANITSKGEYFVDVCRSTRIEKRTPGIKSSQLSQFSFTSFVSLL
jgi:hypothetical protein